MKFKIQLVLVNAAPADIIQLDIEKRQIQDKLSNAAIIFDSPAARITDVITALRKHKPDVVHFSAHGFQDEIVLLNDDNKAKPIPRVALAKLFEQYKDKNKIRLVVLNACYSARQAQAIKKFVDCVIGVSKTIPDASARRYSLQLYDALASGSSVLDAHREAEIVMEADRLPKDRRPQLLLRKGVDPSQIYLVAKSAKGVGSMTQGVSAEAKKLLRTKKNSYGENKERYDLRAESFSLTKIVYPNGSSDLIYELKGLEYDGDGAVDGLYFLIETQAGLVSAPLRDKRAEDLHISWEPDPYSEPSTMEDVIDRVRRASGKFWFDQSLKRKLSYTFGWTVRVLNGDALTAWDFDNMYPTPESRQHVNGNILDSKTEYLARLAWLPMRKLEMKLQFMPGSKSRPRLRYFDLKNNPVIPREELLTPTAVVVEGRVVTKQLLQTFPRRDSQWYKAHAKWEANFAVERIEDPSLRSESDSSWKLAINYPLMGTYYSVDVVLDDPEISGVQERFIREAAEVRKALLAHRGRRKEQTLNAASTRIVEIFGHLHDALSARFRSNASDEKFETTLMTYDDASHRLLVAEGRNNGGEILQHPWDFYLPFGLGLAGACFRAGAGAFTYSGARDDRDPLRPEPYLPHPGSEPHAFLIAFPIDHPDLYESNSPARAAQRCRQLVGVLTIASSYGASPLLEYCTQRPTDEAKRAKLQKTLAEVRNQCQSECDEISCFLLGKK